MARFRDFFENFRATAARKIAVASVKRAERNLARRLRYWERKQMPGVKAVDPRRNVTDMTTNQLKAYAREINAMRGDAIKAAGISAPGGELLPIDTYGQYESLWEKREASKRETLKSLKLKGIPQNPKIALLDVDPLTGELRPERGGNYVLQPYGDVQIPQTKESLERRISQMRKWKSIPERIQISNNNVKTKLDIIDPFLAREWDSLNDAQKQYLINNENIFDFLNQFTFSTKDEEVRAFWRQFPELATAQYDHLFDMIESAKGLEKEYE